MAVATGPRVLTIPVRLLSPDSPQAASVAGRQGARLRPTDARLTGF